MNKFLKITALLLLLNFGGCCNCDSESYFNIKGMTASNQLSVGNYQDEDLKNPVNVPVNQYRIKLEPTVTYYSENGAGNLFDWLPSFANTAYACSCVDDGYEGTDEQLSELIILSNHPFDSSGSISDTLSKYFDVYGILKPASSVGGDVHIPNSNLVSFLSTHPMAPIDLRLKLNTKPTGSLKHRFTIIYTLTNGEVYTMRTAEVEFAP